MDKSKQRMIFHAMHALDAEEQKALDGFRAYIRTNNFQLPAG
jgi:hypothetical protein